MIDHALADLAAQVGDLPVQVLLATGQDEFRKPAPGMWRFFAAELAGGAAPDVAASFFCGDAAGRTTDFATGKDQLPASSDRDFAAAVGLKFTVPEELFGCAAAATEPLEPRTPVDVHGGGGGGGGGGRGRGRGRARALGQPPAPPPARAAARARPPLAQNSQPPHQ
jgi:hypothetical protein